MRSIIKLVKHPHPTAILQARIDHANITKTELIERPWWYEDIETGMLYYDIFSCVGWPSEVSDKDTGLPGYIAIVGIKRPKELSPETYFEPKDAKFILLDEGESDDVPTLLDKMIDMRERYGFGINGDILSFWYGDPDRFVTTRAIKNERLIYGVNENKAILVSPPEDFYVPKVFDVYVRSIRSCLIPGKIRFYFRRGNDILANRLREFRRDDPTILAMGGLLHTLLNNTMWMSRAQNNTIFNVEEG